VPDRGFKLTDFGAALVYAFGRLSQLLAPNRKYGFEFLQFIPRWQKPFGDAELEQRKNCADSRQQRESPKRPLNYLRDLHRYLPLENVSIH
jgi:hypothetical protein